jgi:chromate transporter
MLKDELDYPPMLAVIAISIVIAIIYQLALGWVVAITLPLALAVAWRKAR